MSNVTNLDFELLEEVKVKDGHKEIFMVKAPEATLKELIDMIIDFENGWGEYRKLVKLHVNKTSEKGDNISRSIFLTMSGYEDVKCIFGQVFMSEFAGRKAYCSTCEQIIYDSEDADYGCEVAYYVTLDEPIKATYTPSHIKEETVAPTVGTEWKMAEKITPFSIPTKEEITKEFITKLLAKMDDIAPKRRGDVKPQTPWESYLLARDDMMCAILEIMLEG
jgi:CxxC motif-containing protein